MAMSELKQKILLHELAKIGFPDAVYIPESDKIKVQPDNDRLPFINDAGDISYGTEHSHLAVSTIRPLTELVNESVAAWERARPVPINGLEQFRMLVAHNNVLLAARDDTELGRGFHFVTWRYNHDRTGLDNGFYTEDYNAAKENFATRAGLILPSKLFTTEQADKIIASVEWRINVDEYFSYEKQDGLKEIVTQLRDAYQIAEPEPVELEEVEPIELIPLELEEPDSELHLQLKELLDKNLRDFHSRLEGLSGSELIDMADKISAMKDMHKYLNVENYTKEALTILLRIENPLEDIADAWLNNKDEHYNDSIYMYGAFAEVYDKEYAKSCPQEHGLESTGDVLSNEDLSADELLESLLDEKPKPRTLAEKMQVANEKVKAQDEQPTTAKLRNRGERD